MGTKWTADTRITLVEMHCCGCGGVYAMDERVRKEKQENGGGWNCPYCGPRVYTKSETDRLREELEVKNRIATNAMKDAKKAKAENKRILTRIENGVCPHCNRHFKDVYRHMKSKHPQKKSDT